MIEATDVRGSAAKQVVPLARDEINDFAKRFEERQMVHRMRLEQLRAEMSFVERELSVIDQTCESLHGIIRRGEEVDVPVEQTVIAYPRYR